MRRSSEAETTLQYEVHMHAVRERKRGAPVTTPLRWGSAWSVRDVSALWAANWADVARVDRPSQCSRWQVSQRSACTIGEPLRGV